MKPFNSKTVFTPGQRFYPVKNVRKFPFKPDARLLTEADVEESFSITNAMQTMRFRVIKGGTSETQRPTLRTAKYAGWVVLALFALALVTR